MYQKSVLPNGIRVVSETIPYVKSVTMGIWIGTGSRFEEEYNHGISHFIEHLMFKGTAQRSAKDIAEVVDAVGGQLNAFTAKEYTCYYLKVLDSHAELALDILSDMLLASKFAEEDIERERQVVIEEVHMYEDSPDELVHDIHLDTVWPSHPLGRNILGTTDSIGRFNRELVMEYYRNFYTPENMVIAAAGNITHEELVKLASRYFSAMTGQRRIMAITAPRLTPSQTIISKDIEQVHVCLGTLSVPQDSPEIYPVHIMNNVLGGGISSRLFQSIREERGLAYSVYSYQNNYKDAGLLTVYAGTRPSNINQVLDLIMENLKDLKNKGISQQELIKSKEQIKGSLLLGLESSSSRMSRIGKMEVSLGKFISLDQVVSKIDQVTLTDINQMIERMFTTENICFTALGPVDAAGIDTNFKF
ncbi:M16 family metallopeptidase [Sporomusa malonica]|uniref:Predicted Zn-dependent peptidase n=1 Tax=Sporomusa malonica TaxID=112901 RepID=A0A1W2AX88_9FIRM|nr:pitrilysin family protein [Sporomusa malonica]SMC65072.1 Predicted Zn-dependent peptidase [Sporomusa malonica]